MRTFSAKPGSIRPGRSRFALPSRGAPGVVLLTLLVAGCHSSSSSSNTDASLINAGKQFVQMRNCAMCHGASDGDGTLSGQTTPVDGSSSVFGSNLTPDHATGIGDWADIEIERALKFGLDDQNQPLCPPMPHYADPSESPTMTDVEAQAIVAYLRSLPPVSKEIPASMCPPIKPAPPVDLSVVPADLATTPPPPPPPVDGATGD